jgi:hypothetical protein
MAAVAARPGRARRWNPLSDDSYSECAERTPGRVPVTRRRRDLSDLGELGMQSRDRATNPRAVVSRSM